MIISAYSHHASPPLLAPRRPGITAAPPAPRRIKTVLRVRPLEPSAGRLSLSVVGAKTVMTINPIVKTGAISNIFKYGKVLDETVPQVRTRG